MREEVESSRLYSEEQRQRVLANLHAMAKSVARLRNGTTATTASNLREALRIRLSILSDNVHGFVSAADIDRRDRYTSMQELLNDVSNQSALLPVAVAQHVDESLTQLSDQLRTLNTGLKGQRRIELERAFDRKLAEVQAELRGEDTLPPNYCGSCYGAGMSDGQCCNSCADLKAAYAQRRWGFPDPNNFEQCRREARMRSAKLQEGERSWHDGRGARDGHVLDRAGDAPPEREAAAAGRPRADGIHFRLQRHPSDQAPLLWHRLPRPAQPARWGVDLLSSRRRGEPLLSEGGAHDL